MVLQFVRASSKFTLHTAFAFSLFTIKILWFILFIKMSYKFFSNYLNVLNQLNCAFSQWPGLLSVSNQTIMRMAEKKILIMNIFCEISTVLIWHIPIVNRSYPLVNNTFTNKFWLDLTMTGKKFKNNNYKQIFWKGFHVFMTKRLMSVCRRSHGQILKPSEVHSTVPKIEKTI